MQTYMKKLFGMHAMLIYKQKWIIPSNSLEKN